MIRSSIAVVAIALLAGTAAGNNFAASVYNPGVTGFDVGYTKVASPGQPQASIAAGSTFNASLIAWSFDASDTFVTAAFIDDFGPTSDVHQFDGIETDAGANTFIDPAGTNDNDITIQAEIISAVPAGGDFGDIVDTRITARANTAGGFVPAGTSIGGSPVTGISLDIGTSNNGRNGMDYDRGIAFFSATQGYYAAGVLQFELDLLNGGFTGNGVFGDLGAVGASDLSAFPLAGDENGDGLLTEGEDVQTFSAGLFVKSLGLQGLPNLANAGADFSLLGIDEIRVDISALELPAPGALALFGAAGLAGARRRR